MCIWGSETHLGVDYLQLPWTGLRLICCAHEHNERRAEEHLNNAPRPVIYSRLHSADTLQKGVRSRTHRIDPAKWVAVGYTIAFPCTH
jgi:hypothetical protein